MHLLSVLGGSAVVPGVDEAVGGHGSTVAKLLVILELDLILGGVFVRRDRIGDRHNGFAIFVEAYKTAVHLVDNPTATSLIGICSNERVLRFSVIGADNFIS